MLHDLRDRSWLVIHSHVGEAEPPDSRRRKFGPANRLLQQLRLLDAGEHYAVSAAIERASDQMVLQFRNAYHGTEIDERCYPAQILDRFEVEISVLRVQKRPLKTARFEYSYDFRRSQLRKSAT